jgi:hypothetical protein
VQGNPKQPRKGFGSSDPKNSREFAEPIAEARIPSLVYPVTITSNIPPLAFQAQNGGMPQGTPHTGGKKRLEDKG